MSALPGTYPGAKGVQEFSPEDDATFWVLDFHAPQGLTPLGLSVFEIAARASREAADAVPMPGTRGFAARVAGSHVYLSPLPVAPGEAPLRAARSAALPDPHATWGRAAGELAEGWLALRAEERSVQSRDDARRLLAHALAAVERAWRIHFDFMYPLLASYFAFLDHAQGLGIAATEVPPLLQGYATRVTETDRAIWALAEAADELGTGDDRFRERLDTFLERFGWRTEGVYEPALVPWTDDPAPVLARVNLLLDDVRGRSFADVERASAAARVQAERAVLGRLDPAEHAEFARALADVRSANFAWWNEEHNPSIDLCSHIPVRRAALAIGGAAGLIAPDDALFLFRPELEELGEGRLSPAEVAERVPRRRELHAQWAERRSDFPQLVGRPPEHVDDPVLREIFGRGTGLPVPDRSAAELEGIAASTGVARGLARVIRTPADLGQLVPREVIVCEATTPSWTPAFAAAAACICDQGGSLTHAAIVSREYGIPCVTGTTRATELIATGDLVEVDGAAGRVRVLKRRAAPPRASR